MTDDLKLGTPAAAQSMAPPQNIGGSSQLNPPTPVQITPSPMPLPTSSKSIGRTPSMISDVGGVLFVLCYDATIWQWTPAVAPAVGTWTELPALPSP